VAHRVLIKEGGHTIEGALLEVKYAQASQYASNKLVICELPEGVDEELLELVLQGKAGLHRDEFSIQVEKQSAVITFSTDRSNEGKLHLYRILSCILEIFCMQHLHTSIVFSV